MAIGERQKKKILIADDSQMNREILTEMLGEEYEIIEAENGAQAVDILEERLQEISVLLLDMVMPEMNGMDVLRLMKDKQWIEDVPVIMISVENGEDYVQKAYDLGVTDYIARPFDAAVVRRRVVNTMLVYAKKRWLSEIVDEELEKNKQRKIDMDRLYRHVIRAQQRVDMAIGMVQDGGDSAALLTCLQDVANSLELAMQQDV